MSFVVVLGQAVGVTKADITAGLIGYWPFDEASGTTAADVTGNGNNGTFNGNVEWVPGVIDTAVHLDTAGERVVIGPLDPTAANNAMTLAAWINWEGQGHSITHQGIFGKRQGWEPPDGIKWFWEATPAGDLVFRVGGSQALAWGNGLIASYPNEWIHVALTWDNGAAVQYVNAEEVESGNITFRDTADATIVSIGCVSATNNETFVGSMDEARIYNRALTAEDIVELFEWKGGPPAKARKPSPADEATDVPRDVVLSWKPGEFAPSVNGHKIYLSENFNDVNDGIGGITLDANSYARPQRLDFNKTYYWRVDEVNGPPDFTVHEGNLWSFTTEPIAYAIGNITATASSSDVGKGPENTVNGSGLDDSGLLHGKEADDNMWLSGTTGPQPTWIEYEFDRVYKLYELWVWNSNESLEPVIGLGFKDVSIEYSVNGTDYTTLGATHEFARAPGASDYAHNTTVDMGGVAAKYVKLTANSNWGGILNQYGLSEVRFFYIPVHAREPYPDSGATDVDVDVILSFRAGREAAQHDVYLSTDEQAVIDGNAPVTTMTETSYGPLSLDLDMTYYWKINEVNMAETPTTSEGDVWSFTTQQFLVVDDFESYNDLDPGDLASKRIFNVWLDGYGVPTNGSIVGYENAPFCERTIVHGGKQSMPLAYSNTGGAAYSEAELTLTPAQDWTVSGVRTLGLWFHGTAGNTGQLYAKINGNKIPYDGQTSNIARAGWRPWNINLTASGLNLQSVGSLAIGIDGHGASGTLYIDDIRLYGQTAAPSEPGLVIVPKTSVAPIIDGELDGVWHNVGETRCLITDMINTASAPPESWYDLFGTFKTMYDANNFYIFVEVQDSVIDYEFSNWQGDGVEIYFDGDNSKGSSYDGVNDNQIRITVDDVELTDIDSSLPVDGAAFKVLLTDLGYNIEASFPLEVLQIYPSEDPEPVFDANGVEISSGIAPNNIIGFEVQINDNDSGGGRETIMRWHSDDNNSWQNPSLFGEARLVSRTVGDMLDVDRVTFDLNVDGVMEAGWKSLPEITCNKYVLTNSDPNKQTDFTDARFSFRAGWDDANIYFFVSVIDDMYYDLQTNHQADGIELFFDADNSKGTTREDGRYDAVDDVQLRINHADLTPADIDITGGQWGPANVTKDNIDFAVVDTWIGYDIEFAIPLADLAIPAVNGHVFGFDIGLNDADEDIRDNIRKYWSGNNDNWRYPALFGEAVLMGGK